MAAIAGDQTRAQTSQVDFITEVKFAEECGPLEFRCWNEDGYLYVKLNIEGSGTAKCALPPGDLTALVELALPEMITTIMKKDAKLIKAFLETSTPPKLVRQVAVSPQTSGSPKWNLHHMVNNGTVSPLLPKGDEPELPSHEVPYGTNGMYMGEPATVTQYDDTLPSQYHPAPPKCLLTVEWLCGRVRIPKSMFMDAETGEMWVGRV